MAARGKQVLALFALTAGVLLWPGPARAAPPVKVAWIRGEAWAQSDKAPARFYPGNLLDGKAQTVACFATDSLAESTFTVGFTGKAQARELRLVNGDGRSPAAFGKSARVAKLILLEPEYQREVQLEDDKKKQVVRLDPPITADQVTLRIAEVHGEGEMVCLSDLIFVARGKPLSGAASYPKWKGLASKIQGAWVAGPAGAAEKFLTLRHDGSYRFVLRPNDPDLKGFAINGRWTLVGQKLTLSGGGPPLAARVKHALVEDDMGEPMQTLTLKGRVAGKKTIVPDQYRDRF
ncbi:MAG: hypothetical protein P1V51_16400 [Deltaproteobacteria bacterium]|nr:hypothetical protein [Deltaproteobacteria bacterium]